LRFHARGADRSPASRTGALIWSGPRFDVELVIADLVIRSVAEQVVTAIFFGFASGLTLSRNYHLPHP